MTDFTVPGPDGGDLAPGGGPGAPNEPVPGPAGLAAPFDGRGFPPARGPRPPALVGLLEIVLVSGLLTDFLVAVLVASLFGVHVRDLSPNTVLLFAVMMTSTVVIVFIAWCLQVIHPEEPRLALPLPPPRGLLRETGFCLAVLPGLLVLMVVLKLLFAWVLPGAVPPSNALLDSIGGPLDLVLFLVSSVVAGGVREEVQRAVIVLRGEVCFQAPLATLLIWSVIFGLEHRVQGWDAVFSTAVLGFVFGVIFLRRRNLYAPFLCHALFNVTVLLLYWFTRNLRPGGA
ncbi:MAG: CPBP family intramembrane metalloprotease [Acidobacteria bacterium]|nr:CPBP family intramembrane metalloprotease [Acidobacteriota bacterium]